MKAAFVVAALAGAVMAIPQAVLDTIEPVGAAPAGCVSSYDGTFQVAVVAMDKMNKREIDELQKRSTCGEEMLLEMTLADGILKDAHDRTGYIASNHQFQFDGPPQAGAMFTGGFSTCDNSSLALGPSTVWYQCLSGDFYNLYTVHWAEQCEPIGLVVLDCNAPNEDIIGVDAALPICQIGDGQIQAHTTPCVTPTTPTPTPGTTTTYEVSTPVITTPVLTTVPTSASITPSITANTTVATPSIPAETPNVPDSSVTPTPTPEGTSGVARLGGSVGALIIGLMAAFLCL